MKANQIWLLFSSIILVIISVTGGTGCANIIPPAGGPRDSTEPLLIRVSPGDSTRNFTGDKINFTFDEYVEITDAYTEVLVSPLPANNPIVNYRLNTVNVKLKDTLQPNTTYTINFGKAIKDINEGNILHNYTYVFSTGPYIDSMEFTGKVLVAETGRPDTTLIVMLHSNADDSAVVKERPRYITKVDGKGQFHFKNLPPKTYRVYALGDEGSRRYLDDKQLFAFADAPVTISDTTKPVVLYAYSAEVQKAAAPAQALPQLSRNIRRDGNTAGAADRRLRFGTNLSNAQQDLLSSFIMTFEQPLKVYDSTKLHLSTDSVFTPVTSWRMIKDSTNKKLQLVTTWKESTLYNLILEKDFAEDSAGRKLLKTDTLRFTTKKLADYGQLNIRFRNLDMAKNPVLLFVVNNAITQYVPLTGPGVAFTTFMPGDYELRILYDDNKNGKWDPGVFFGNTKKQPELVHPIERKIVVKPNWENDFEIAL